MHAEHYQTTHYLTKNEIFFHSIFVEMRKLDKPNYSIFKFDPKLNLSIKSLHEVHLALLNGEYRENYWDLITDYTKCFRFFTDTYCLGSVQRRNARKFYNYINEKVDSLMINLGHCCGTCYINESCDIFCSSKRKCFIEDNTNYYRYKEWLHCESCYAASDSVITLDEDLMVEKNKFKMYRHIKEAVEEFVECIQCERLFHERCILHIKCSGVPYCCTACRATSIHKFGELKLSARDLPSTECDKFITKHMEDCGLPLFDKLTIRLVSNNEKTFDVKKSISKYRTANQITYNNCSLFAFCKTDDGNEICFFGCYFQLYGDNCEAESNRKCAYLSYIDSVKLLNRDYRTKVYQQLLIGLFKYLNFKQFSKIFIWSCPPKLSGDYIFLEKPKNMKIPTANGLIKWYNNLLALAKEVEAIVSFVGVDSYARDNDWKNLDNVPYFDDDLLPTIIQEAIKIAEKRSSMSNQNIVERIWKEVQWQTEWFDRSYFIITLKENAENLPTLPMDTHHTFANDRCELTDYFRIHKLEFSDERMAKFSSHSLTHKLLCEASVCKSCKKSAKLDKWLQCEDCSETTSSYEPPSKKRRVESESLRPVLVDLKNLQGAKSLKRKREADVETRSSAKRVRQQSVEKQVVNKKKRVVHKKVKMVIRECYVDIKRLSDKHVQECDQKIKGRGFKGFSKSEQHADRSLTNFLRFNYDFIL